MDKNTLYIVIFVVVLVFIFIALTEKDDTEDFANVLGSLGKQRRFLNKCLNNCSSGFYGVSRADELDYFCADECYRQAEERERKGVSDLSQVESLNHPKCAELKNAAEARLCDCQHDTLEYCQRLCAPNDENTRPRCVKSCFNTKVQDCIHGLSGGWKQ